MADETLETTCCIAGGGPAGVMLGYLLVRAGVQVTVLEKHSDFFRDFRGDTVHPSTLELFYELGLLEEFLELPHQELTSIGGLFGDFAFQAADFRRVSAHCKFIALMPQWDFLAFLVRHARTFPSFELRMQHEVTGLIRDSQRIAGVEVQTVDGRHIRIRADLVAGCDGRHSIVRKAAQLDVLEFGVPIDVLWFRISRQAGDPDQLFGNVNYGKAFVLINRGDYFQAGLIVRKGSFEEIKQLGLGEFRNTIRRIAPHLGDRVEELRDWDQVKLLTVQINRLRQWFREGLLCIGDAAHAMSPAGGVGINLAIQDAVAAARLLAGPLKERRVTEALLAKVQERREFPTRATQFVQVNVHRGFARIFRNTGPAKAPWQMKLAVRLPGVQRLLGHMVGIGIRPEHIRQKSIRDRRKKRAAIWIGIATGAAVTAMAHLTRRRRNAGTWARGDNRC